VYYYRFSGGDRTILSRITASGNPLLGDPSTEMILMEFPQPFTNHNGGTLNFGPDGYLYVGLGDGGSGGDPNNNSQNLNSHLGKMLRIDVNTMSGGMNYSIPPTNPFANTTYAQEIFVYGLRNPWKWSFDSKTGLLWLADVGQDSWEEIDIIHIGKDYGWRIMEGPACFNPNPCSNQGLTIPIFYYNHSGIEPTGNCIIGGYVYRGTAVNGLYGKYLFADYTIGKVWYLSFNPDNPYDNTYNLITQDKSISITSFGVDEKNEVYFVDYDGKIYTFSNTNSESVKRIPFIFFQFALVFLIFMI